MLDFIRPIYVEDADLANYPSCDQNTLACPRSKIVVGDLHGNALKLLHILVTHGMVSMPESQYHLFKNLYNIERLDESGLAKLREIIDNIEINPYVKGTQLLLMGDILADRGSNDFYTLYLLKRLHKDIKLEILLSNHDAEFIDCMENGRSFKHMRMSKEFTRSAYNLQKMMDSGLISHFEVKSLYNEVYKPALKAVSYAYYKFDDETSLFAFFTHAPAGLNTFKYMAKVMGVEFSPNGNCLFAESIDMINASFQKHVKANTISELIDQDNGREHCYETPEGDWEFVIKKFPFASLIWTRDQSRLVRPDEVTLKNEKVKLMYFNGHDSTIVDHDHVITLDNEFGKGSSMTAGTYFGFYFQDHEKNVPTSSMVTNCPRSQALLRGQLNDVIDGTDEMDCASPPRQMHTSSQSCKTSPQSCDPSPKKLKLGKNARRNVALPQFDFARSVTSQDGTENEVANSGQKRPRRLTFDQ